MAEADHTNMSSSLELVFF